MTTTMTTASIANDGVKLPGDFIEGYTVMGLCLYTSDVTNGQQAKIMVLIHVTNRVVPGRFVMNFFPLNGWSSS